MAGYQCDSCKSRHVTAPAMVEQVAEHAPELDVEQQPADESSTPRRRRVRRA